MKSTHAFSLAPHVNTAHGDQIQSASLLCLLALSLSILHVSAFQTLNLSGAKITEPQRTSSGSSSPQDPKKGGIGKVIVGGTAGAAGAGAGMKACSEVAEEAPEIRNLARGATRVGEEGSEIAGLGKGAATLEKLSAESRATEAMAAKSKEAFVGSVFLEAGGDAAEKAKYLESIGPYIARNPSTRNLTAFEIESNWIFEPRFRANAINQLAENEPEELAVFGKGSQAEGGGFLKPIEGLFTDVDPLVRRDDAIEVSILDDKKALPVSHMPKNYVNGEFEGRIKQIVSEALDNLPPGTKQPTNAELKAAITKALKPDPKWHYSFNAQSGNLTLRMSTVHGEITAEPNVYKIVRRVLYLTGIGTSIQNKDEIVRLAKKYFGESGPSSPVAKPS